MAGVACGWLVAYPLIAIPVLRGLFRRIELRPREYLRAIMARAQRVWSR
jgi:hypothetical protein